MAGRGPAPAEKRRRSNEPARGEWVDLPPLEAPILDEADPEWPTHVVALWDAWRLDPVTAEFSASDLAAVRELARRYDALQSSEQRLRMDGLGLTPKGKRDLRWRVADAPAEVSRRPAKASNGARRARLSVVK